MYKKLRFTQEYGLWDNDENQNIESLVIEMRTTKENVDNGKLLLDVLPRSALGYEFDIITVSKMIYFSNYTNHGLLYQMIRILF